jgi:hypothetical protein
VIPRPEHTAAWARRRWEDCRCGCGRRAALMYPDGTPCCAACGLATMRARAVRRRDSREEWRRERSNVVPSARPARTLADLVLK